MAKTSSTLALAKPGQDRQLSMCPRSRSGAPQVDSKCKDQLVRDVRDESVPLRAHVCKSLHGHQQSVELVSPHSEVEEG